jgi:hypothetical protein
MRSRTTPWPARKRGELEQDRAFRELMSATDSDRKPARLRDRRRPTKRRVARDSDRRHRHLTLPHE